MIILTHGVRKGEREALVARDLWSGFKWVYPSRYKDRLDTLVSMRYFYHGRKVKVLCTDKAPQFAEVCKLDRIVSVTRQPGVPRTNGII